MLTKQSYITGYQGSVEFPPEIDRITISGSWCPNCHDEAPFLAELYKKYRDRGLEVVTLSFEEEVSSTRRPSGMSLQQSSGY